MKFYQVLAISLASFMGSAFCNTTVEPTVVDLSSGAFPTEETTKTGTFTTRPRRGATSNIPKVVAKNATIDSKELPIEEIVAENATVDTEKLTIEEAVAKNTTVDSEESSIEEVVRSDEDEDSNEADWLFPFGFGFGSSVDDTEEGEGKAQITLGFGFGSSDENAGEIILNFDGKNLEEFERFMKQYQEDSTDL